MFFPKCFTLSISIPALITFKMVLKITCLAEPYELKVSWDHAITNITYIRSLQKWLCHSSAADVLLLVWIAFAFPFLCLFLLLHDSLSSSSRWHYFCLTYLDCIARDALLSHLSIDKQTKAKEILSHQPNWTALTWIRISKWKYVLPDQEFKPHIKTAFDSLSSRGAWMANGCGKKTVRK